MDDFLKKIADHYDKLAEEKGVTQTSRVVPVGVTLSAKQWVLPSEQALALLKDAETLAVVDCICRDNYKRCDKPVDVCIQVDRMAEKALERRKGREITLEEATGIVQKANEAGLVHLSFHTSGDRLYALCSCCECCCHDLQLLMKHDRKGLVARADYLAATDERVCTLCGQCEEACAFNARKMEGGELAFDAAACYGCGVCVPTCPEGAIKMEPKG